MKTDTPSPRIDPSRWDELRLAFHRSLMIDTPLASLAQNIDGCVWPLEGADEKPSAYIDLSHAEALARLRARGLPADALDDLAEILRGTLSFDESFGEMAGIAAQAEAGSDPMLRNLEKLGIPAALPVWLCALSPNIRQFCLRENLATLGDFLQFSRNASRQIAVAGDFRDLLNAVAHIDEQTLARYLPFRPKTTGLHLVEAVAQLARPLEIEERMKLVRAPTAVSETLRDEVARRVEYFAPQAERMRAQIAQGVPLTRQVVVLDDLSLESAVVALLTPHLAPTPSAPGGPAASGTPDGSAAPPRRRGLLRRLLTRARG